MVRNWLTVQAKTRKIATHSLSCRRRCCCCRQLKVGCHCTIRTDVGEYISITFSSFTHDTILHGKASNTHMQHPASACLLSIAISTINQTVDNVPLHCIRLESLLGVKLRHCSALAWVSGSSSTRAAAWSWT